MRPCIARLASGDFAGSHSLARLAWENELSGVRPFRCTTLLREGLCLGLECLLYRAGLAGDGGVPANARSRGGVRGVSPVLAKVDPAEPTASMEEWHTPKHQRKGYRR